MLYYFQCSVALLQILSGYPPPHSVLFRGRTLTAAVLQEMKWSYNFEQAVV